MICTDFAPEMIEAARRNGAARGLENVEYRVLDAESMDLADDSVDGVVSRWSYMLMADPGKALSETNRVLRDGGTLAFAVWQTPDRNLWAAIPGMTLVQRGHMPPPEPGAPGIFALGEADRLREVATGAGFEDPQIEELTFEWRYAADDLWETITKLAGPLARVIKGLPADERAARPARRSRRVSPSSATATSSPSRQPAGAVVPLARAPGASRAARRSGRRAGETPPAPCR